MIVTMAVCDTVKNPLEAEGRAVDAFCTLAGNGGLHLYQKEKAESAKEADEEESSIPSDPEAADHPYNIPEAWSSVNDTIPQLYVNYRYRPEERRGPRPPGDSSPCRTRPSSRSSDAPRRG